MEESTTTDNLRGPSRGPGPLRAPQAMDDGATKLETQVAGPKHGRHGLGEPPEQLSV
jgi:hypothetical protein